MREVRMTARWSRVLVIAGLVVMLIGTLDPLEGSVLILAGIGVMTAGAVLGHSRVRRLLYGALALGVVGVGALFAISAVGGFGGNTGRSMWWSIILLPYPAAWVLALVSAVRLLRTPRPESATR
jgi:hypothetical protein